MRGITQPHLLARTCSHSACPGRQGMDSDGEKEIIKVSECLITAWTQRRKALSFKGHLKMRSAEGGGGARLEGGCN